MLNASLAATRVIDAHVEIVDGSYHDVDSNEMAFKLAAIFAVRERSRRRSDPARAEYEGRELDPG